jgi:NAD(P)-dependent dehydrogenase (short-subunit alcohol dehydrogenase family)
MSKESIEKLFSLENKVVVVTGGCGMLAKQFKTILTDAGARVIMLDIDSSAYYCVDITNKKEVDQCFINIKKTHGRLDVLINNASVNPVPGSVEAERQFVPYEDYSQELWDKELSVNITGAMFVTQAAVRIMKKQYSGSIINISSTYGNVGPDNRLYEEGKYKSIAYATTKGAMLNFTRAWASYLAGTGIRVNTLSPGGVEDGQPQDFVKAYESKTILGRMARKDEYNAAILFLASDASIYMTGSNFVIDGGWTAW